VNNYVIFLIQLTEKDKRILVALFLILILLFVLVAYIGQGIKALMRNYAKGIDGYMHELCSAKLIDNPRDFRKQVFKKERKVLYQKTKWIFRVFIVSMVGFVAYTLIVKPGGESEPFAYLGKCLSDLWFKFEWPRGEFFGIKNFPVDWPVVAKVPSPKFNVPSVVSYVMLIIWIVTVICVFTSTLRFISRINRARAKANEVFSRSLDDVNFNEGNFNL
jgi:ABC-type multidrug transport system fused ATPase/permease subunit